jgi:hypothetical protein
MLLSLLGQTYVKRGSATKLFSCGTYLEQRAGQAAVASKQVFWINERINKKLLNCSA